MNKKMLFVFISFFSLNSFGQGTLTVEVQNFKSYTGHIYLSIFNTEEAFLKVPFRKEDVEVKAGKPVILEIKDLPFGDYSVSIIQDENENANLDTGMFGIPKEGYGFSNNVKGMFGPPSYKETLFTFSEPSELMQIDLIHPPF